MEPTFSSGSMLLVDTSVSSINSDAVYVIGVDGQIFINRIQRNASDKGISILSDNKLYDTKTVREADMHTIVVYGRVRMAWNIKKM
jgi:phage repressor protein C with HTH and peptisase S24 domain